MSGTGDVLTAATARLSAAMTGVVLPPRPNGATVNVFDGPPDQPAGLPAAWAEVIAGRRVDNVLCQATVRYLVVPRSTPNEALAPSVCAAVDALEGSNMGAGWSWSLQSIQIGGVDQDCVVFDVPTQYPSTCP